MWFRRKSQSVSLSPPEPVPGAPEPKGDVVYQFDPGPSVPREKQDEPVRALKAARVALQPDGIRFTSLHVHGMEHAAYGPQAEMECRCGMESPYVLIALAIGSPAPVSKGHTTPAPGTKCGFYAWKYGEPFPFRAGEWVLEVDLYGCVVEHERGYRAQKQRVLRASPVLGLLCEPPFRLVAAHEGGTITAACGSCPALPGHVITAERLRAILNVEIDLDWARSLRDA